MARKRPGWSSRSHAKPDHVSSIRVPDERTRGLRPNLIHGNIPCWPSATSWPTSSLGTPCWWKGRVLQLSGTVAKASWRSWTTIRGAMRSVCRSCCRRRSDCSNAGRQEAAVRPAWLRQSSGIELKGCLPHNPTLLDTVRLVRFRIDQGGDAKIEHGKSSIGKSISSELAGAGGIPGRSSFARPRFCRGPANVRPGPVRWSFTRWSRSSN